MTATQAPFVPQNSMDELFTNLRTHNANPKYQPRKTYASADKAYGQIIGMTLVNGVIAGLWTWAAVAAFSAGGGWVVLGGIAAFFAACAILGTLASLMQLFV